MSELETIFQKYQEQLYDNGGYPVSALDFDLFKLALTEVAKLVEVTDEELASLRLHFEGQQEIYYRLGAKWSRDLSKTKLEKLIG